LVHPGTILVADITFDDLKFGKVTQVLKVINRTIANTLLSNVSALKKAYPVSIVDHQITPGKSGLQVYDGG
jgi:hypothetical protein